MLASLMISSRAVSGSKRTEDETEFRVLKRKCGLIWFCKRFHAGLQQQPLLFFQLDLDAHAVPRIFKFGSDYHDRRGVDRQFHPPVGLSRLKVSRDK